MEACRARALPAAILAAAALLLAAAGPADWRASPHHDPVTLYRIERPRSPVPRPPEGVAAITAEEIARAGNRVLLVDVSPVEAGRFDAASGRWTLAAPAATIPGAVWLPGAGQVPGDPGVVAAFMALVPKLAAGRPVVVFCLADCWMSWNAALRLHRAGLRVAWYGEGREGWVASGRPLVPALPEAVPQADPQPAVRPGAQLR